MGILLTKIKSCKSLSELDELRADILKVGKLYGQSEFEPLQKAFIKQKNIVTNHRGSDIEKR